MGEYIPYLTSREHPKFRLHAATLRKQWGSGSTLRYGKHDRNLREIVNWAKDHLSDEFTASMCGEVFVFRNPNDALFFKLRWNDILKGTHNECV